MMSQDRARRIKVAVTEANRRIAAFGLSDVVAITYTGRAARLLRVTGPARNGVVVVHHIPGEPFAACRTASKYLYRKLSSLLHQNT